MLPPIVQRRFDALPDAPLAWKMLLGLEDAARQAWASPGAPGQGACAGGVMLYGAGELGQLALAWCRQVGLRVRAVLDVSAERWREHPAWRGVDVLSPEQAAAEWSACLPMLVCISTLPAAPIALALQRLGWLQVESFYDFARRWHASQPMHNGWRAHWPGTAGAAALRGVLAGWADDVSRAHHLQFAAWRLARQEWSFDGAPVQPAQRWAIPEFEAALQGAERLLDGGAHHGQLAERWQREHPGRLAQAWLVEPDPEHVVVLQAAMRRWGSAHGADCQVLALALSRRGGERRFASGEGYGCRLWPGGRSLVQVARLDDLQLAPTVVKLHLEGHEWPALQGGLHTLRRHRPVLALTVYHRRDGLHATAKWLMRELPRYRWLFRLHGWLGTGAVVYGIPEDRALPSVRAA